MQVRYSERVIEIYVGKFAKRLVNQEYANADEYNTLRNILDLEPMEAGKFSLFKVKDDKDLIKNTAKAKMKYNKNLAAKFRDIKTKFAENLQKKEQRIRVVE